MGSTGEMEQARPSAVQRVDRARLRALALVLALAARLPAPLRRMPRSPHRRGARSLVAVLLVLGLAAPIIGPIGATAAEEVQEDEPDQPEESEETETLAGAWRLLREEIDAGEPEDEEDLRRWTDQDLRAVHFATDDVGFAVGGTCSNQVVARTDDGGDSWTVRRLPELDPPKVGCLNGVHVVEADEASGQHVVVAVGDGGVILRSSDGGRRWFLAASGVSQSLNDVDFPTSEVGYIAGDPLGGHYLVLKTTDGGLSWQRLEVREPVPNDEGATRVITDGRPLRSVHFLDAGTGVVAGGNTTGQEGHRVLRTENGGAWWVLQKPADGTPPRGLQGVALLEGPGGPTSGGEAAPTPGPGYTVGQEGFLPANKNRSAARSPDGFKSGLGQPEQEYAVERLMGVSAYWSHRKVAGLSSEEAEDVDEALGNEEESEAPEEYFEIEEVAHAAGFQIARDVTVPVALTRFGTVWRCTRPQGPEEDPEGEDDLIEDFLAEPTACERRNQDQPRQHRGWVAEPIEEWDRHLDQEVLAVSASPGGATVVAVGTGGLMLRRTTEVGEVAGSVAGSLCAPDEVAEALETEDGESLLPDALGPCPKEGDPSDPRDDAEVIDAPPPVIEADPARGRAGAEITVRGQHWQGCIDRPACQPSEVTLSFVDNKGVVSTLATLRAKADGTFEKKVKIPPSAAGGEGVLRATGRDPGPDGGAEARAPFLVRWLGISVSPSGQVPGEAFTVSGNGWHACPALDPTHSQCKGVKVSLSLRQDARDRHLGEVTAESTGSNGSFSTSVEVPETAVPGAATIRAEAVLDEAKGDPEPDGGVRAQAGFEVLTPCRLTLDDTNPDLPCLSRFSFKTEPDSQGNQQEVNATNLLHLFFDPGLGEEGRVVGVFGRATTGQAHDRRIFLFDPSDKWVEVVSVSKDDKTAKVKINDKTFGRAKPGDDLSEGFSVQSIQDGCVTFRLGAEEPFEVCQGDRIQQGLKQRGVPGFARGFDKTEGGSKDGDVTGVVNYDELDLPGASRRRNIALDTERHRLYMARESITGSGPTQLTITAMSLVGEFEPETFQLARPIPQPADRITHLAVDSRHSVLYAVTAGEATTRSTFHPTNDRQRNVEVHALPARVVGEGEDARLMLGSGESRQPLADRLDDAAGTIESSPPATGIDQLDGGLREALSQGDAPEGVDAAKTVRETEKGLQDDSTIEPSWSLYVGDRCATTVHEGVPMFFGVSRDGRRLSLPCQGTDLTVGGAPVTPVGILTLRLPEDPSPRELTQDQTANIVPAYVTVPGGGMGPHFRAGGHAVRGDHLAGLMTWRTGDLLLVWDVDRAGWVASATGGGSFLAADPVSRRIYVTALGNTSRGQVSQLEALNLPGSVERSGPEALDTGLSNLSATGTFDPATRRIVAWDTTDFVILEDRTPPPQSQEELHPDRRTNDLDEHEAAAVNLEGDTSAYGARVWWTGLRGSLQGSGCLKPGSGFYPQVPQEGQLANWLACGQDPPALTYDDLMSKNRLGTSTDVHTGGPGSVPWQPYRGHRDLFSARVERAQLFRSESALGFSGGLSEAQAWGLDTGDRTKNEGTSEDVRGRRGTEEWRDMLGARIPNCPHPDCREEWEEGWEGEDAQAFDRCSAELYDRLMREIDGELRKEPSCLSGSDPQHDEKTGENQRDSLEEHLGLTQLSECTNPHPQHPPQASTLGSAVTCDFDGQSTLAAADNALQTELPGGVEISIDGSFSGAHTYRDEDRGLVSQAVGVASGVSVKVAGVGSLRIGEVLTTAEAWANGRPGGAGSTFTTAYKDVRVSVTDEVTDEAGQPRDLVVFSCDPHEDQAVVAGTEFPEAVCDPEELVDIVAATFGGRLSLRVPRRDWDEVATGTPGGAQALVRRDRVDYYNDMILFDGMDREEIPGLQIEINADGSLANRFRLDLAAVYAGAIYNIGERHIAFAPPAPGMVEAPIFDHSQTGTVQVALVDTQGSPLEGGTFELSHQGGLGAGCVTGGAGQCEISPLPLGSWELHQRQAPAGFAPADPISFELSHPGQVARITVVNGRQGQDGSEVREIIEIIEGARPAASTGDEGSWWRRALGGLPNLILNPWTVFAIALITSILATPAYLAKRRRELLTMREVT